MQIPGAELQGFAELLVQYGLAGFLIWLIVSKGWPEYKAQGERANANQRELIDTLKAQGNTDRAESRVTLERVCTEFNGAIVSAREGTERIATRLDNHGDKLSAIHTNTQAILERVKGGTIPPDRQER